MKKSGYIVIGIVVFLTIIIMAWGVNFLKGKNFFKKETAYYSIYDNINLLEEAGPVTINGLKVGLVRDIYLHPDNSGRIVVKFFLTNENVILKKQSYARIYSLDLMGSRGIELIQGNTEVLHKSGDTLAAAREEDLVGKVSAEILPVKIKAESLMASIDSVMAVIQYLFDEENRQNIAGSFESIKYTLKNLEKTSVQLDTLVVQESSRLSRIFANIDTISHAIKKHSLDLENIISNISTLSDTLASAEINTLINDAESVLKEISTLVYAINTGSGSLGKFLKNDSLYNSLVIASENLDLLIRDIRINPKRYLHFSALDFGKTVIVSEYPENEIADKNNLDFRVLILTDSRSLSPGDPIFKGVSGIEILESEGKYYYLVGKESKLKKIKKIYNNIIEIFPQAEIISMQNGKINKRY